MTRRTARVVVAIAGSLMVLAGAATVWAQRGGPRQVAPIEPNTRYDGRFTFIRLRYGPPVAYAWLACTVPAPLVSLTATCCTLPSPQWMTA